MYISDHPEDMKGEHVKDEKKKEKGKSHSRFDGCRSLVEEKEEDYDEEKEKERRLLKEVRLKKSLLERNEKIIEGSTEEW